jgi:hypothetical protein
MRRHQVYINVFQFTWRSRALACGVAAPDFGISKMNQKEFQSPKAAANMTNTPSAAKSQKATVEVPFAA